MAKIELPIAFNLPTEWMGRFVALQLKELQDEALSQEDELFLAKVEFAARVVPGVLEDALMQYGVGADFEIDEATPIKEENEIWLADSYRYRIAASTSSSESALYQEVQRALEAHQSVLRRQFEAAHLDILQIHAAEGTVEPCYQEGYTFIVERKDLGRQTVGKFGGIVIAIKDLEKMTLEHKPDTRTIRLYEK